MRRRAALMIALLFPAAIVQAQTVRLPQGGGVGSGPPVVIPQTPGTVGRPGGLTTTIPNSGLQGTLPVPKPAPKVIPPTAAGRPGAPDGGDSNPCDCFVTESTPIVGPDGRVSYIQRRRATGQKHLSCCPR